MPSSVLEVLHEVADAVHAALAPVTDWRPAGERAGQYAVDLVADAAALAVLERAGMGVLSEESGVARPDAEIIVVLDPVDGSTNASHRLPWYATSACAVDGDGPLAAVVANQFTGERFAAVRGGGATLDGRPLRPTATTALGEAVVGISGLPGRPLGWWQFRALGAAALDICAVAAGRLDAFVDCSSDGLAPWDYLGALLVCEEVGVPVVDVDGRELAVLEHGPRRTPVAAATPELLDALVAARRSV